MHNIISKLTLSLLGLGIQGSELTHAQDSSTNSLTSGAAVMLSNSPSVNPPGMVLPAPNSSSSTPPVESPDTSAPSLDKALAFYRAGKVDETISTLSLVIQSQPKNLNALILMGAAYSQKQDWESAEKNYQAALQLDTTNDGVRYDLADLKFKQKQFEDARTAFVPLQKYKDPDIADLIAYKIFVCDLVNGHDDVAAKELDAFNQAAAKASYYFGNAAWALVHKKPEEARTWLESAASIFPQRKHLLYMSIFKDLGYLPLPPPPAAH